MIYNHINLLIKSTLTNIYETKRLKRFQSNCIYMVVTGMNFISLIVSYRLLRGTILSTVEVHGGKST